MPASVLRMGQNRELAGRPIRDPRIDRQVGLLQMRGRSLSTAAAAFQQAIRERCTELSGRKRRGH